MLADAASGVARRGAEAWPSVELVVRSAERGAATHCDAGLGIRTARCRSTGSERERVEEGGLYADNDADDDVRPPSEVTQSGARTDFTRAGEVARSTSLSRDAAGLARLADPPRS